MIKRPKLQREPIGPGPLLREMLEEMDISQEHLARKTGLPLQTVNLIVNGKRGVTAGTAVRLAKFFDMAPEFWMNAQTAVDLHHASAELEAAAS
jgi:addiction module HigA family antidote